MDTQNSHITLKSPILETEQAYAEIVAEMNTSPIHISLAAWQVEAEKAQTTYDALLEKVRSATNGLVSRPNAPQECVEFFLRKGAKLWRKTGKGDYSADKGVLQELSKEFPVANDIIAAREALSVLSQLKKWLPFAKDGMVQPIWNQFGTPMGRLSCEHAALQNRVMEVRRTVVPRQGKVFLSFDGKQMEYRTYASLSQNLKLLEAFYQTDRDFHEVMGQKLVSQFKLRREPRKVGKTLNFALLYRMQDPAMAAQLGVSKAEAEKVRLFFESEGYDPAYAESVLESARRTGSVSTYFGRVASMPRLQTASGEDLREIEKTAWHHHNAGTAADLFKMLSVHMNRCFEQEGVRGAVTWLINMHDEQIWEVDEKVVGHVKNVIRLAVATFELPEHWLPIAYTMTQASNWADLDS